MWVQICKKVSLLWLNSLSVSNYLHYLKDRKGIEGLILLDIMDNSSCWCSSLKDFLIFKEQQFCCSRLLYLIIALNTNSNRKYNSPETLWKLCLFIKFLHLKISSAQKKWSFPLRISSVNVINWFGRIYLKKP